VHVCIGVRFLTQDSARAAGRRDQSGDWCLSRSSPLVSWDVARTAHDTTGTTRGPKALSANG
jgi:hypothetical protein